MATTSPNFAFLAPKYQVLADLGTFAERYLFPDPNTCLMKLRQFGEICAQSVAAEVGEYVSPQESILNVLRRLEDRSAIPQEVARLFHGLRKIGNIAIHEAEGERSEAHHQLRMAYLVAVWFQRTFGKTPGFKPPKFVTPEDPQQAEQDALREIERLRLELAAAQATGKAAETAAAAEALRRTEVEARAAKEAEDRQVWQSLAEEYEKKLADHVRSHEAVLASLQAQMAAAPKETIAEVVKSGVEAGQQLDLTEADTRALIDRQLREAGWEADSENLTYAKGARPTKGQALAIAEWPTQTGPADYVLFIGLKPVGIVEAKKKSRNVAGAIEQAKRYSRGYLPSEGEESVGGPWGEYRVPFLFSTNGRPFLQQVAEHSGIWFLDARRAENHARSWTGWYTPEGLLAELARDVDLAHQTLRETPTDFLPLRYFQREAVDAIENRLAQGQRNILVAMATGTGKTITSVGLTYRLIKAKRFRRVLFLVDRTVLGGQAHDAFRTIRLEAHQTFSDIYDVKELKDLKPDTDTKLHIATIQGLIKRILFSGDDSEIPSTDSYDCLIVDECHRGYCLDREMTDQEMTFRSESDYISKYRRVLDHFDAVKIGLTATPALHTTQIFGDPAYTYSYRQAVIDGFLVDHEPPLRIVTRLAQDGISWTAGEEVQIINTATTQMETVRLPDDVDVDVDDFNTRVRTENFNRVVCQALARHIDPELEGKTLIFCVTDDHADLVVRLMKEALDARYGGVDDDAVVKITGQADQPGRLYRRYRNERLPSIAVTVDLLTTGIDVPRITNLVFLRRVRSRILYEQMLGRATRLYQDGEFTKEAFRIFDAVDLYSALEPYTTMKPVVVKPQVTFRQLFDEVLGVQEPEAQRLVLDQLIAKFQRKRRALKGDDAQEFEQKTGMTPTCFLEGLASKDPARAVDFVRQHLYISSFLDGLGGSGRRVLVSLHEDQVLSEERGYGTAKRPEDYLEAFRQYLRDNMNLVPALVVVTQRPRDLTRRQLRELQLELDKANFTELALRTAWKQARNEDVAATIIGFIRSQALGSPLVPYSERVDRALRRILNSRPWTDPQRKWLERISKQLKTEVVVDREVLDSGEFRAQGGYSRVNKALDGQLDQVLHELTDLVWADAA